MASTIARSVKAIPNAIGSFESSANNEYKWSLEQKYSMN